jgi:hypothetical protein
MGDSMRPIRALCILSLLAACSSNETTPGGSTEPGANPGTTPGAGTTTPPGSTGGAPRGDGGGQPRTANKRGVAYGHHSEPDLRALSKGISWWYNWAFEPDPAVRSAFSGLGVEYVPMVWGAKVDTAQVGAKLLPSATTLLGFNEPNFYAQANLSARDAAQRWPGVQAVADAHGLTLVSPAVNFCGGGCQDTDPFAYLDAFFAACPGCRVDAVAVHLYVGCAGDGKNHAQWLINHLKTYESRFEQPLWLTEFACHDAANAEQQRAFMIDAVTYLESDPRIARYAWFAGRADNVPHVDLLGADGQLTELGKTYVELPHAAPPP